MTQDPTDNKTPKGFDHSADTTLYTYVPTDLAKRHEQIRRIGYVQDQKGTFVGLEKVLLDLDRSLLINSTLKLNISFYLTNSLTK
jgi:hypothetical protein